MHPGSPAVRAEAPPPGARLRHRALRGLLRSPARLSALVGRYGAHRARVTRRLAASGLDDVLRRCPAPGPRGTPADLEDLALAVEIAEALFTSIHRRVGGFPDTCLYRSLTRFSLVSSLAASPTFVIGVRPDGLATVGVGEHLGHAWIEVDGRPFPRDAEGAGLLVSFRHRAGAQLEPRGVAA